MIPPVLLVHTVTIAPLQGVGGFGETYGPAADWPCWAEEVSKLVTDSEGRQVVSSTSVYLDPEIVCPAGSRVTFNGATKSVISVSRYTSGGLTDLDHQEVHL